MCETLISWSKGSITQNLGRLKDWLDQMSRTQYAFANSDIQASRKKIGFELAIFIDTLRRKYFILWDIVNPQLGSGLGLALGSGFGLGLDSVRWSTISHKMKYLSLRRPE